MRRSPLSLVLLLACAHPQPRPARPAVPSNVTEAPRPPAPAEPALTFDEGPPPEPAYGRRESADPSDVCAVADSNLARTAEAILRAPAPEGPVPPRVAWDHRATPASMNLLERRYGLLTPEREILQREGFVVLSRVSHPTWADALHDVYRSQLPLYVSADAIFHAVYRTNDAMLGDLEATRLAPLLDRVLSAMHTALPEAAASHPPEVARDLDLYLTVARSLLAERPIPSKLGVDAEAAALVRRALEARELAPVELFGRERMVDFSQYTPRGHYASRPRLTPYFRAAMWASRLEFNVVSRSSRSSAPGDAPDPRETPREALGALALADLAARSGALREVERLDRAWAVLAGRREDLSISQLLALRDRARLTDLRAPGAFEALRAAIGEGFQRTARVHYMPQGSDVLPVITTLLGPRIPPDTAMTRPIVHGAVADRYDLSGSDAAYALGHDRALRYLASDLAAFPTLRRQLDEARAIARRPHPGSDLYGAWYDAVLGLAERPSGVVPSFMETEAFADLRLNSAVTAYGQLRHNYVLMVGQSYDEGGCEIPDGFVEPAPAVFDALITYAERGEGVMRELSDEAHPLDAERRYFTTLVSRLRVLRAIVRDELANRPLTADQRQFLSMVVEMSPGSTGGPPTYTGWYFDLFRDREGEGLASADFIADWYTSSNTGQVAYLGARAPRMGVFVVDTGGAPRLFVGPVARGYEHRGPLEHRLTDEEARELTSFREPWAERYTAPSPREPRLQVSVNVGEMAEPSFPGVELVVRAPRAVGRVTFRLLDHHRAPQHELRRMIPAGTTRIRIPPSVASSVGAFGLEVGGYRNAWDVHWSGGTYSLGGYNPE